MHRRAFLASLATLAAATAIDPDRLLWEPGKKTYFDIQKPGPLAFDYGKLSVDYLRDYLKVGDIFTIQGHFLPNPHGDVLKEFVVVRTIRNNVVVAERAMHVPGTVLPTYVGKDRVLRPGLAEDGDFMAVTTRGSYTR